jgi:hypothetical protein
MKNLHLLPTDKPSRIFYLASNLHLEMGQLITPKDYQHICITNDEEIKEGDWCLWLSQNRIIKCEDDSLRDRQDMVRKIILTTDQDLIADGVQSIDDEFLEWFVKNPSCEKVEVIYWEGYSDIGLLNYEIIIPQEEPKKFGDSFENLANVMSTANFMFGVKEEPKQETLEETAERLFPFNKNDYENINMIIKRLYWIDGAKWQTDEIFKWLESKDYLTDSKETIREEYDKKQKSR